LRSAPIAAARTDRIHGSLGELGPGAIVGERAIIEGGRRTASLRAITKARVAVVRAEQIDAAALTAVRESHRREESRGSGTGGSPAVV
jgi:CRP-like cAMP-binding protein